MSNIGYIRISSRSAKEEHQRMDMIAAGIESDFIFCDRSKSKEFNTEQLEFIAGESPLLSEGDTLYVIDLNCLGKTFAQIEKWVERIVNQLKCNLHVISNSSLSMRAADPAKLLREFLSWAKDKEGQIKFENQRDGIIAAHEKGVKFGRTPIPKPENWDAVFNEVRHGRMTSTQAMKLTHLKRSTYYRFFNEEIAKL